PHQNGKAERTWRTLFGMARCLLLESGLPKMLWSYAVMAAAYIRNRCYSHKHNSTSFEVVTGRRPNISNMRVFGTLCYALVQGTKKLDDRSMKGLFVGYDKRSPAYLVYFPDTKTIKRVRSVRFPKYTPDIAPVLDEKSKIKNTEQSPPLPQIIEGRNTRREITLPKHFDDFIVGKEVDNVVNTIHYCYTVMDFPTTYEEAISSNASHEWQAAMDEEMFSLRENNTYTLKRLPPGRNVVGSRWVYTIKKNTDGSEKYKARFVAKGFSQKADIDYKETFSPTANMTSVRTLMQLAVQNNLTVHQMDVKSAYLNAPIDCEIYVQQPRGYEVHNEGQPLVWELKKSLYGLKQSGKNWNDVLHGYLTDLGFKQSLSDTCVYTNHRGNSTCIVIIWVDDILIATHNDQRMNEVKDALKKRFKMKDLGKINLFLGIEFTQDENTVTMSQSNYLTRLLARFGMENCKPKYSPCDANINKLCNEPAEQTDAKLYREIVGSLIYAMHGTRPDLCFAVTKLSQYMSDPSKNHMAMAKQVLRYLKRTIDQKLVFKPATEKLNLIGFCDADWANSGDRKSITGYGFELTPEGPLVAWKSKKQQTVALSTCEAEYMSLAAATQEGKFLKSLIRDMTGEDMITFTLNCDNQGSLALAKNPVQHNRSKHIDIKYHFVRDEVKSGTVQLLYVPSDQNIADIFTKAISTQKTRKFRSIIMGT
ncbi:hypothetical protein Ahia01_000156700, partial [Argonauta hians]